MAEPGLLLLDKPVGPSSFSAIARLRPVLGRKVGHAGTLDPFASGLLLVFAGRATRLVTFLAGADKRYLARVRLGVTSTTDDPEGELAATGAAPVDEATLRAALPALRGEIEQVPPAASAIHVDGERAYQRFRRGEAVVVPTRRVTVRALELVGFDAAAQEAELDITCSTGTYVRALARDLGALVGSGGHCAALRRLAVGPFSVEDAATPERALAEPTAAAHWRAPADAVPHLPVLAVDAAGCAALAVGRRPAAPADAPAGPARVLDADGRLVAIARVEDGHVIPLLVLEAV